MTTIDTQELQAQMAGFTADVLHQLVAGGREHEREAAKAELQRRIEAGASLADTLPPAPVKAKALVHPATGEVIDPDTAPLTAISEFVDTMKSTIRSHRDQLAIGEAEIARRLADRGEKVVIEDGWENIARSGRSRVWDADGLEGVMADIVGRGVLPAAACVGVIKTKREVSGTAALTLRDALVGEDRAAIEACYEWKQGKPSVQVTQVQA